MLTPEDKIKLLATAICKGNSERAGCNDNEEEDIKELTDKLLGFNDEQFNYFCIHKLPFMIAYGI